MTRKSKLGHIAGQMKGLHTTYDKQKCINTTQMNAQNKGKAR